MKIFEFKFFSICIFIFDLEQGNVGGAALRAKVGEINFRPIFPPKKLSHILLIFHRGLSHRKRTSRWDFKYDISVHVKAEIAQNY